MQKEIFPSGDGHARQSHSAARRALRAPRIARIAALLFSAATAGTVCADASPAAAPLDLARHRGRVVIVDFWASWCKPCRRSIPWLNTMRERYGANGLTIIGVNVDAERSDADKFLRDVPIEFEIVFDPNGELAKQFKVQGMPSSYVFDRTGKLVESFVGFRDAKKDEHEAALRNLLHPAG
ncbi:MAG TPA: TlpA disulfide reductase family protein [Steroidobacteraceae bacterium]|nr:TlpA disulfide reductase family protein [Steroidobacteraceae bacterium]